MTIGGDDDCSDMTMSKGKLARYNVHGGCSLDCGAGCDVTITEVVPFGGSATIDCKSEGETC